MWGPKIQHFTHLSWAANAARGAKSTLVATHASAGSAGASSASTATGGAYSHTGRLFSPLSQLQQAAINNSSSTDDDQERKRPSPRRYKSCAPTPAEKRKIATSSSRYSSATRTIEALSLQSAGLQSQLKRAFSTVTPSTPTSKPRELSAEPSPRRRRYSASAVESTRSSSPFIRPSTPALTSLDPAEQSMLSSITDELTRLLAQPAELVRNDVRRVVNVYRTQPHVQLEAHTKAFEALLHIRQPGRSLRDAFSLFDEMPSRNMAWKTETIELAIQSLCMRELEIIAERKYLEGQPGAKRPVWAAAETGDDTWSDYARDLRAEAEQLAVEAPFRRAVDLYLTHWRRLNTPTADALLALCATPPPVYIQGKLDAIAAKIVSYLEQSAVASPSAMSFVHILNAQRYAGQREAALQTFERFEQARDSGVLSNASSLDALLATSTYDNAKMVDTAEHLMQAGIIGTLFDADEPTEALAWLEKSMATSADASVSPAVFAEVIVGFAQSGDAESARRWLNKAVATQQPGQTAYLSMADALLSELASQPALGQEICATLMDISEVSRQYGYRFDAHRWWPVALNVRLDRYDAKTDASERHIILEELSALRERFSQDQATGHATPADAEVPPAQSMRLARAFAAHDMYEHAAAVFDDLVRRVWVSLTPAGAPQLDAQVAEARKQHLRETAFAVTGISKDGEEQVAKVDQLSLESTLRVCRGLWAINLRPAGALAQLVATKYIEMKIANQQPQLDESDWAMLVDACAVALISPTSEPQHIRTFASLVDEILQAGIRIDQTSTVAWTASTISSALAPEYAGPLLGRLMQREPVVTSPTSVATPASDNGVSDLAHLQSPTLTNWTPPSPVLMSPLLAHDETPKAQPTPQRVYDDELSLHLLSAAPKQRDSALAAAERALNEGRTPHPQAFAKLIDILSNDPNRSARALRRGQVERLYAVAHECLPVLSEDPQNEARLQAWASIEDSMLMARAHFGELDLVAGHRDRLVTAGCVPSADAYATMILNMRDTTDDATVAVETFTEARRLGVVPNAFLYNTLISRLSRARRAADALRYFHEMRAMKVEPTSVTYGSVINACCKTGDEAQARQLFEDMVNSPRYIPRHPPYNTMIQFFQSRGDRTSALEYFDRLMRAKIPLTDHTYRLLIDTYGAVEPVDPASARDVFRMLARDPNVAVQGMHWAALITMYGTKLNDVESVVKLFDSISSHQSSPGPSCAQPDSLVYEALFNALWACGRADLVEQYRQRMVNDGVPMTAYTANALIKGYGDAGHIQAARDVFTSLEDPETGVAGHSAHHHAPRSHPEPTRTRMLPGDHIYREPSTYEALMVAEMQAGHRDDAVALFEAAVRRAFPYAVLDKLKRVLAV